jgi:hypothetical protein
VENGDQLAKRAAVAEVEYSMDDILFQGPGYTIARTHETGTLVPFPAAERPDGSVNHGWIDLRDHPERVAAIPEATRSRGLAHILTAVATPGSHLMSGGCECASFERPTPENPEPRWAAGGYVDVMFREADRNVDARHLIDLARRVLGGIAPVDGHHIGFEMIIEPLKLFFGRTDCHALMIKPLGYGTDEPQARAAFEVAAQAVAQSLRQIVVPKQSIADPAE